MLTACGFGGFMRSAFGLVAIACVCIGSAEAQRAAMPDHLNFPNVSQPADAPVAGRGDFDGDGALDTLELIAGTTRGTRRLQARLHSLPDAPFALVEGPATSLDEWAVAVGPPGRYAPTSPARPAVDTPNDVVMIEFVRPGFIGYAVKHWSRTTGDFATVFVPGENIPHRPAAP